MNGKIHIVKAGTVTIRAEQDGDATYQAATPVTRDLVIAKAELAAQPHDKTKVYLEALPALTIQYTGFVNGENASVLQAEPTTNTNATINSTVGVYDIWLTGGAAENYTFRFTEARLTITQASQTITFNEPDARVYGDADFALNASTTSGLPVRFVNETPQLVTITGTQVHILKAGLARIRAEQDGNTNYRSAQQVIQVFPIEKAPLTATAEDKEREAGTDNPALTVRYTGFLNGDDAGDIQTPPIVTTIADRNSPAGVYDIVASGAVADNYRFTYVKGKLTVTPATQARPQTITFPGLAARTYGDADIAPGASASSNLTVSYTSSNTNVATIVNGSIHIVGAGTTTITARQPGDNTWLAAAPVSRTLTVHKAPLTITADNKIKAVGDATPALTATYNGFVKNEGPSVLGTIQLRTAANEYSRAGTYPITIHYGNVANYEITAVNGFVTVNEKPKDKVKAWASSRTTIQVNVFAMNAQNANIVLYSTSGQRVVHLVKRLYAGNNSLQLDVSKVPTGMYILQIGGEKINLSQNVAIN